MVFWRGRVALGARSLHDGPRTRAAQRRCRQRRAATAAALLALAYSPLALAWGPQGHRAVGAIADRLLTPPAHAAVTRLLADDLDRFGNPSGRTSLEEVSVWADELQGTPAAHARWHYDNLAVCGATDLARACRDGECASEQLKRQLALLADTRAPARQRNEALKWVVHLVADLHQPLHAADNNDRGGNEVQVALAGVHTRGRESLHRAWDNDLVKLALGARNGQQVPRDIDALAGQARALVAEAGQGSPDEWLSQANNLARNIAYRYPGFTCGAAPRDFVRLDAAYVEAARGVVRERLLLAGARLANLLNQTLGGP